MTILGLIVLIIVVGVVLGAINTLIPMAGAIKSLLKLLIVYILQFFALIQPILPIPKFFNF